MKSSLDNAYDRYYEERDHIHIYPVEFVVRTLLGTYPDLQMDREGYQGSQLLDLGYGDGRNMPLYNNLKFNIHGVEITDGINELARERLSHLGIDAELRTGNNADIPYPDSYFDYIIACHSCYYVSEGSNFAENLTEITRVLKPGGVLVASLPTPDNFIFEGAVPLGDGHLKIDSDPYGVRNGTVHKTFLDKDEVMEVFSPFFNGISLGHLDDDYYGVNIKTWIIKGVKK